ncbi:siderophore ABC transporter substrate-binding protein [Devosia sp. RR2S18]|uniref:siderophore ABC transporter substrate-binding protein n=1 Tax=Devosia rhizosphaerae TaxID=3049774 RepID=UPI0025403D43|nr:ABC transporter substrate-binding protein [Devosia sp. RR2S18]WIJ24906.1 ABC transporter substrate-binding protein [Devosia sp. RR2S18]
MQHHTRISAFAAALMAGALSMTSLVSAQETTITHAQGETTINGVPETVLVQDWAVFDNLSALGVEVDGVPSSNAPSYLADQIPADAIQIGSLFEPDFEGIAAAEADIYLVAGRSRTAYPTASEIVPTVDLSIDNNAIVEGVKTNLTKLGEIFDAEDKAAELISNLDAKVAEVQAAAEDKGNALVLVTNAGNIGVYGPDSRVSWIYNEIGLESAMTEVEDGDHGGDSVSFEYILEMNPDWLFVIDRDAGVGESTGAAAALLDNELVNQTSAAKQDQIVYLDPQAAYITMHGYNGLMLMLDEVLAGLDA